MSKTGKYKTLISLILSSAGKTRANTNSDVNEN